MHGAARDLSCLGEGAAPSYQLPAQERTVSDSWPSSYATFFQLCGKYSAHLTLCNYCPFSPYERRERESSQVNLLKSQFGMYLELFPDHIGLLI